MGAQRKIQSAEETPLAARLKQRIARDGPISVHDYMQACLADRDAGYYMTRRPIGKDGDFVTAPEISQMFGELIGVWAAAVWQSMGEPAGDRRRARAWARHADGRRASRVRPRARTARQHHHSADRDEPRAARDAKRDARRLPCPAAMVREHRGPAARPAHPDRQRVHRRASRAPVRARGRRLARAKRHARRHGRVRLLRRRAGRARRPAAIAERHRRGRRRDRRDASRGLVPRSRLSPRGRKTRPSPRCSPITAMPRAASAIRCKRSAAIASPIPSPRRAKPISPPMSISPRSRHAARALGLAAYGPMPQGEFLLKLGLEARCERLLRNATPEQKAAILSGAARLADPRQMGLLFKMLALQSSGLAPPPPFGDI